MASTFLVRPLWGPLPASWFPASVHNPNALLALNYCSIPFVANAGAGGGATTASPPCTLAYEE
jgi:hypothetical protein